MVNVWLMDAWMIYGKIAGQFMDHFIGMMGFSINFIGL
jgi:hypothetical protein